MKGVARKIRSNQGSPPAELGFAWRDKHSCRVCLHFGAGGEEGGWGGFLEGVGVGARVCRTWIPVRMVACTGRASGEGE